MCTTIPRIHGPDVRLKWHQLRRDQAEAGGSRENLAAGIAAGAVMEVDLRLTRDQQWVCLHDGSLDVETSGSGLVRDHTAAELGELEMRSPNGELSGASLLFLDDLVDALGRPEVGGAEIQLDLKVGQTELSAEALERFASQVAPHRASFSLSGEEPAVLASVRRAVPELPVTLSCSSRLGGARDAGVFESRMRAELEQLDGLAMIWVNHRVLQAAYRARFDLVGYAHLHGVGVDTGTIDVGATGWRAALVLALQAKVDRITSNSPCDIASQVERWMNGNRRAAAATS